MVCLYWQATILSPHDQQCQSPGQFCPAELFCLQAINIATFDVPGVEADDVIGTLSRRAVAEGMQVAIVSTDQADNASELAQQLVP